MTILLATVGVPGSGKTRYARAWVAGRPKSRARVSRDDLRDMLHGARLGTEQQEAMVTAAAWATVDALLRQHRSVIYDATNLHPSDLPKLRRLARQHDNVGFQTVHFTDVPLDECLANNEARRQAGGRHVPPDVIRDMWTTYQAHRTNQPATT